jgi:hypothetical protein
VGSGKRDDDYIEVIGSFSLLISEFREKMGFRFYGLKGIRRAIFYNGLKLISTKKK